MAVDGAGGKPMWLFYHLQNEKGESSAHPNACRVVALSGSKPTLQDVINAFPLTGTGSFHFRFQISQDGAVMFLDVLDPSEPVPMVGGNIIAKVLRLDNMRTMSRATFALQPRQTVAALASARVPSASAGDANRPASESGVAASVRRPTVSAAPGAAAVAGRPPAASPPLSAATSGRPPAAANVPPLPAAGGAGGGSASPASSPPPPAHVVAAALVPELRPVKRVADIGPVVAPEKYDADLEGKSDYVKKTVMERREREAAAAAAAVAEVAAKEAAAKREQDEREAARSALEPGLKAWAEEATGTKKNIRVLLSSLQTVLWPGATWEPVPMAKLIDPKRVRFAYLKAVAIVHPDKHNTMSGQQIFIATSIFHYIESAWAAFREAELGGA